MANSLKEQSVVKTNKRREEEKRLKKLETSIRSKVAAEERAHRIVERLVLDDEITEEFLLNSGNFLMPSHYADVVEERFLSHECGYPLCHNKLSKVPSQKYKISTKTNRVYDIRERKCFCSNFCYKASKYFESQISASPVWTRLGESPKTFSLLKRDVVSNRTGAGNVLLGNKKDQHSQSSEIQDLWSMDVDPDPTDKAQNDISFLEDTICGRDIGVKMNIPPSSVPSSSSPPSSSLGSSLSITTSLIINTPSQGFSESDKLSRGFSCSESSKSADFKESVSENIGLFQSVQNVLRAWCTPMTLEYLGLSHTKTSKDCDGDNDQESSFFNTKNPLGPGLIKANAAQFPRSASNVQVQPKAESEIGSSGKISPRNIVIKENKTAGKDVVCVLPPIDSRSQHTIRRRIVLDSLFQTLPVLLSDLKLTFGDISRDLTGLVHTFSLNSQNVTLKPLQWKIIGLALIQLLRKKNSLVSGALQSSPENFSSLLCRLKITQQELDSVMSSILPCQPQYLGLSEQSLYDSRETSEATGEKLELVGPERVDYGEMEELD